MPPRCLLLLSIRKSCFREVRDGKKPCSIFNKMEQLYEVESYLSPAEAAYIDNPDPEEQECILFGWRYECAGVLLWAAGVVDDLPYPSEIIDVPVLAAIFWQHKGIGGLLSKGFSRSQSEILDAADITLRYDWACVEARVHGKEAPASLNGDVVMELSLIHI